MLGSTAGPSCCCMPHTLVACLILLRRTLKAIKEDQCDSQILAVFGTKGLFLAFTHIALVLVGDSEACHEYPKLSGQVKISALLVPCAHC